MPTYQYKCTKCGHEFDEFQNITDPPINKCPKCKGKAARIISGGAGFLFKGNGFYETDYRSSEYKKKASEEKKVTEPKSSESGDKKETSTGESKSKTESSSSKETSSNSTSKSS